MQYLWQFYLLVGLVIVQGLCLAFGRNLGKNLFLWICFLEFAFIAGFRAWDIGNDTLPYIYTFIASAAHLDLSISHMEKGYLAYNKLLALFTSNPQSLLIANALITLSSIFVFIKRYSSVVLLPVLLFLILSFGNTMNLMRQYLAVAIVLWGVPFIIQRKFIAYALCCCGAATFHQSVIVALGLYFIYPLQFKLKHLGWILIGTLLVFVFIAPLVDRVISITGRYGSYRGNILLGETTKLASVVKMLVQVVITSFCLFSYRFVFKRASNVVSGLNVSFLLWCSVLACCFQFISIRGTVMERLVVYFSIFNIISLPLFVRCYPRGIRAFVAIGLLGCFVLYQSIIFVYRPEWNYILPFRFCF